MNAWHTVSAQQELAIVISLKFQIFNLYKVEIILLISTYNIIFIENKISLYITTSTYFLHLNKLIMIMQE